jgi:ubiquinone biosynthesis protein COQ4
MDHQSVKRGRLEWRRAWRALRGLIADSGRTDLAIEIIDALAGRSFERAFETFRGDPEGRRLLAERPSLLATLMNRDALRALPVGSFGRAYVEFMHAANLRADGLAEAEAIVVERNGLRPTLDADHDFFANRSRDMHDLWHVLTGYGMDEAGEAALLAFNLGQVPSLGIALIVGASTVVGPNDLRGSWPRYLFRAGRRGRRAVPLMLVPYERLLPQPLEAVRRLLRIQPAREAHPDGILVGNRSPTTQEWMLAAVR